MQCPTHVKKLQKITSPQDEICELCGRKASYYCKNCKYLQCSECRVCSARHQLIKIIDLCKVKSQYYNNAYACNTCQKSKVVDDDGIWHCNQCNYDLCLDCAE